MTQTSFKNARFKLAKRVTLFGALINFLLGIVKLLGGYVFHSSALVADGFHSLSDLLTDAMVLIASKYGSQDADDAHPYGHKRIETAATYVLAFLLILTGFAIALDAIHHLRAHTYEHPEVLTIPLAVLSIAANEGLFWYTRHVGQSIQSELIVANAWHHRSDAASSMIVLIGLAGSLMGYPMLDSLAALIVALMIIKMGLNYALQSIRELIDTGVAPEVRTKIKQVIHNTNGVIKVHQLRTRLMGGDIFVDVHVQVDPMISVSEGHFIAQHVHYGLKKQIKQVKDVTVHIDPEDDEVVSPSFHLPNRTHLETSILNAWREDFPEIKTWALHYLDNQLIIDLVGELTPKRRESLLTRIEQDQQRVPTKKFCIRIQTQPELFYEGP